MINTSTEYKRAALEDRRFTAKIVCLLKNGTTLHFDETNLVAAGMKIADGTSANNSFTIGSAIINQLTVQINNSDEKFSDYDFTDARLTVSVGMKLADRTEWLKKGVFVSEDPTTTPSVITIKAFDNMRKFDKTYDGKLSFPCNLQAIVQYCCDKCGMMMGDSRFPNYDYVIPENPFEDKSSVTYRAILSYCAMIACCFARCNVDGQLELKWYDMVAFDGFNRYDGGYFDRTDKSTYQSGVSVDGGNFTDYTSGDSVDGGAFLEELPFHHIYSLSSLEVSTEDVVITGIKVQATDGVTSAGKKLEGETYLCGAEGYVLSISGNPLIRYGKAKEIATYIGSKALGMRFRPLKANALGDPSWEAGDAAVVTDRKNNSYQCYITNLTYAIGAYANLQCDAEPAKRHSADRYAEIQKIVADIKKDSQQELDLYTQYVERMNQLAMNAMGYYETTEVMDDGSTITYMHDKPLLKDSKIVYKKTIDGFFWSKDGGKTYTGGIDKNGNAVMNVIATIGLQADWINTGRFTAKDAKGVTKFLVDADTGLVEIHPDTFTLAGKTIDEIADSAVGELDKALTTQEVFNRLTNNGKIQGLYMKNNQMYVNASYITSGTFVAKDKKGTTKFLVNADTGEVEIHPDTFTLAGKTVDDIASGAASTAASAAVKKLDDKLTAAEVFNRLTNNGQTQGIYLRDGKIYINLTYAQAGTIVASMIKGGTLTLGGNSNVNGKITMLGSDGTQNGYWNNNGINANGSFMSKASGWSAYLSAGMLAFRIDTQNVAQIFPAIGDGKKTFYFQPLNVSSVYFGGPGIENNMSGKTRFSSGVNFDNGIIVDISFLWRRNGNTGLSYGLLNEEGGTRADGSFYATGSIACGGTKYRVVDTKNYGKIGMNAVESAGAFFEDVGSGVIGENEYIKIPFDPVFSETIDMDCAYYVFVTQTSTMKISHIEKHKGFFNVFGEKGASFDWRLTAKQRGYAADYMENFSLENPSVNSRVAHLLDLDDASTQMQTKVVRDEITKEYLNNYLNEYEEELI